jgi:hypothetical protein
MTKEEIEKIKKLVEEWMKTLDTEEDYWDGVNLSNKGMAEKFMKGKIWIWSLDIIEQLTFFDWLEKQVKG